MDGGKFEFVEFLSFCSLSLTSGELGLLCAEFGLLCAELGPRLIERGDQMVAPTLRALSHAAVLAALEDPGRASWLSRLVNLT